MFHRISNRLKWKGKLFKREMSIYPLIDHFIPCGRPFSSGISNRLVCLNKKYIFVLTSKELTSLVLKRLVRLVVKTG